MYDANGPVWYRGWALDDEEKVCVDVEKVLAKTGTRRMIMGHTPDFSVRTRLSVFELLKLTSTRTSSPDVVGRLSLSIRAFHMPMAAYFLLCLFIINSLL
jgi:hypothetical protein